MHVGGVIWRVGLFKSALSLQTLSMCVCVCAIFLAILEAENRFKN